MNTVTPCCAACRYRQGDARIIERSVAGLTVFGSAFGASIGASALCLVHDRLVSPKDACARFRAREGDASRRAGACLSQAPSSLASLGKG